MYFLRIIWRHRRQFLGTCADIDNLADTFPMILVLAVVFCRGMVSKFATEYKLVDEQLTGLLLVALAASRLLLIPYLLRSCVLPQTSTAVTAAMV